eukprot:scaffold4267_cov393-Prasinococcus_capsulatus_cf.AAC.2
MPLTARLPLTGQRAAPLARARITMLQGTPNPHRKCHKTLPNVPNRSDYNFIEQVRYTTGNEWAPLTESEENRVSHRPLLLQRICTSCDGTLPSPALPHAAYGVGRYWTMWNLPMFATTGASNHLTEECPKAYIRVIGLDANKQVQAASFVVVKEQAAQTSLHEDSKDDPTSNVWGLEEEPPVPSYRGSEDPVPVMDMSSFRQRYSNDNLGLEESVQADLSLSSDEELERRVNEIEDMIKRIERALSPTSD